MSFIRDPQPEPKNRVTSVGEYCIQAAQAYNVGVLTSPNKPKAISGPRRHAWRRATAGEPTRPPRHV